MKPLKLPDTSLIPTSRGETVVEIIFSRHTQFRAIVTKKSQNIFRIQREKWSLSEFEHIGRGYWEPDEQGLTLTDQLETAQALAREKLAATTDGFAE
jgi:hypothetical protein